MGKGLQRDKTTFSVETRGRVLTFTQNTRVEILCININYRAFSHDVTAAMLVYQDNPVGVELFPYVNAFFCSNKFA